MGKRKAKRKAVTKVKQVLQKTFKCPFCSFPGAIECKLDRELGVGALDCRNCQAKYQTNINGKGKGKIAI